MCGIGGICAPDLRGENLARARETVARMMARLSHRGPDGVGEYVSEGVVLGHRRLAILDLESGDQPMGVESGAAWITFNGEIYNHRELRQELESHGTRFRTRSDTEVLAAGYERWGAEVFARLNGMFALAIWDARRRSLVLARDRLGKKPLYYATLPSGGLVFASELKALFEHPGVSRTVATPALAAYLSLEYVPGARGIVQGVSKLPPGSYLVAGVERRSLTTYWSAASVEESAPDREPHGVALWDLLLRSVERRLVADVPVGVFLSGGIDSSAVACAAAELKGGGHVETFSIGFEDSSYDESAFASEVAKHLGTRHHSRVFTETELLATLDRVALLIDEPLGDPSLLATILLSEFARQRVKVALGGDGSDELQFGYPTFLAERWVRSYAALPRFVRTALRSAAGLLPRSDRNFSLDFVVASFLRGADQPAERRHPAWLSSCMPGDQDDPLHRELRSECSTECVFGEAVAAYGARPESSHLSRLRRQYCATYLPDDILQKVDRASMMTGLEVRAPFLDPEVVSLCLGLSPGTQVDWRFRGKRMLRDAMRGRLPAATIDRRKKGFGIPVSRWLRGPLRPRLLELLDPRRLDDAGYFDSTTVTRLVQEHLGGRRNHRKVLWTLLIFEIWRERYAIGGRAA